eukprot:gene383-10047_t
MYGIHRTSCRRDALFKLTDRGKRISGIPTVEVLSVTSRAICVRNCLRRVSCLSINFRSTGNNENNCELVDLNKSNSSAVLTTSAGWDHYEPVNQIGPRCRLVACDAGFACHESCSVIAGYECKGIPPSTQFSNNGYTGRSGVIQQYTVLQTGSYRIEAGGARGGKHVTNYGSYPGTFYGGYGAKTQGDFFFPAGTQLNIVVGHRGGNSVEVQGGQATTATAASLGSSIEDNAGTGGGGGSFVYSTANVLYIAAGGGGGATAGWNGVNGQAGQSGAAAVGSSSTLGAGGTSGNAGGCCNTGSYHGGVGAGWHSVGGSRAGLEHGERGGGISQGWVGGQAGKMNSGNNGGPAPGAVGGFGGGGGGSEDNGASGGGGGYSGGGTGGYNNAAGGGGGSFCGGTNCLATTGGNTGSEYGYVKITMI